MNTRARPEVICRLKSLEAHHARLLARRRWNWKDTAIVLCAVAGVVMALWR